VLGRKDESLDVCGRLLKEETSEDLLLLKARLLADLGRFDEAIGTANDAIDLDPRHISVKSYVLEKKDDLVGALEALDKALRIEAKNDILWHRKASLLSVTGDFKGAVRALDIALGLNGDSEVYWTEKGELLAKLGHNGKALEYFDSALAINEDYAEAWLRKGEALDALGRKKDADVCMERAMGLDTGPVGANEGKKGEMAHADPGSSDN